MCTITRYHSNLVFYRHMFSKYCKWEQGVKTYQSSSYEYLFVDLKKEFLLLIR